MYPVTSDFLEKMRADRRQVFARVEIDYTDPFIDQSIQIEANEQANVSYPQQTADSVDQTTRKYACLDGTWDLTTGEYHLAPSANMLTQYQMGWWGAQFADQDGYFAQPYPTLTVRHLPRPIRQFKVVGDTAREEWPVDFQIKLYGPDDTLLKTETVTGNNQVSWSKTLDPEVLDVAKQELIITRWSHAGRCAKIVEFFTSIREVYETGDLVSVKLLEEREASQGSLPVGNISANEVTIALNNESKKFDIDNENSPLKNMLKPNRRIRAWLGTEAENATAENPPTFSRNSPAYLSDGTQVAANQPRFEVVDNRMGWLMEEGTENLLPSLVAFTLRDHASRSLTVIDDNMVISTCIAEGDTAFAVKSPKVNVTEGEIYTFSFYAKANGLDGLDGRPTADDWRTKINWYDGNNTLIAWDTLTDTTLYEYWKRYIITAQAPTGAVKAEVIIGGDYPNFSYVGAKAYFKNIQLEAKPYPTSFMNGTRAAESLTIPTEGVLNPQEGTVEFIVIPNYASSVVPANGGFTDLGFFNGASPYSGFLLRRKQNLIELVLGTGSGYVYYSYSVTWNAGDKLALAVKWDSTTIFVLLDGQRIITAPKFDTTNLPSTLMIGNRHTFTSQAGNALYDDLRISNRARSDAEILAAYQSGQPLERDAYTTYLLSFNGSIYPVEQCWVPLGTFWSLDWDSPDDTLEATVTARDRMELLRKGTYQTSQVLTNKSLYELAEGVLQDAGLSSNEYVIDTTLNNIRVPYAWFNPVSHREALRRIAEAALAAVYADRDGKIRIESFASTGSTTDLEITEDDYFTMRAPSKQGEVANEIIVNTQPLRPKATAEEVYRSNEPIAIPASSTKTVTAFYNSPPVIEATASLDNPPAGVSISAATYYGWGASVTMQNTNATPQQVTLVITGKQLTVQNKERAIARDEASILENGLLTYEFPANPLVQTLAQAQAIANTLLASVKDPRRDIEVEWRGNPALLLGDRVTVKGKDYHVIRQEINWQGYLSARLTGRKA